MIKVLTGCTSRDCLRQVKTGVVLSLLYYCSPILGSLFFVACARSTNLSSERKRRKTETPG